MTVRLLFLVWVAKNQPPMPTHFLILLMLKLSRDKVMHLQFNREKEINYEEYLTLQLERNHQL